jgi:hypothetical protein
MTRTMQASELRVGVTGQRALSDEASVSRAVRALIADLDRTWDRPEAAPIAWTVVSALAAGADCLVAEAVLEQPGARLEVITPFALAEYRKDFTSPRDRERLERLLRRAAVVQELDAVSGDSQALAAGDRGSERNRAYLRGGEEVVRRCELLIAIWNGRRAAGLGGTGDIVEHALTQERIVLWIDANQAERPTRVIRSIAYPAGDDAEVVSDPLPIDRRGWSRA